MYYSMNFISRYLHVEETICYIVGLLSGPAHLAKQNQYNTISIFGARCRFRINGAV